MTNQLIRKLTAGQGKDYNTGYFLDYEYIKYHYRLIAADLLRLNKLDSDRKEIQQILFVGKIKNRNNQIV